MKLVQKIALIGLVLSPLPALAYVDPGSGSAIMSAIIGFFVVSALVVKTFWYKIKSVFTGKKTTPIKEDQRKESENV